MKPLFIAMATTVLLCVCKVFSILNIGWLIVFLPMILLGCWFVFIFVVVWIMTMIVILLDQRGYKWHSRR